MFLGHAPAEPTDVTFLVTNESAVPGETGSNRPGPAGLPAAVQEAGLGGDSLPCPASAVRLLHGSHITVSKPRSFAHVRSACPCIWRAFLTAALTCTLSIVQATQEQKSSGPADRTFALSMGHSWL